LLADGAWRERFRQCNACRTVVEFALDAPGVLGSVPSDLLKRLHEYRLRTISSNNEPEMPLVGGSAKSLMLLAC
jgi:hypothetical protein